MTKPLTSTSVADALAECYKNSGHWGSRRETFSIRDGPFEKLWGRGGGIFEPQEFFFVIKFLEWILAWKSFGVNWRAWIFFIWSPLERIFFLYFAPPPHPLRFSNGPSLMSLRQNGFGNLAKLASWSHSVQVKDRKASLDPSWLRFCCLRCFFQKNVFFFVLEIVLFQMY